MESVNGRGAESALGSLWRALSASQVARNPIVAPNREYVEKGLCGAQLRKKPGRYCKRAPMANGRCYLHGGKVPAPGPSHPNYRTGKSSKYWTILPESSQVIYDAVAARNDWAELRDEVHLLEVQIIELYAERSPVPTRELWQRALEEFRAEERALVSDDRTARLKHRFELKALLEEGLRDANVRREVRDVIQDKRKLVEAEGRRMVQAGQVMFADQAAALFHAMTELVQLLPQEQLETGYGIIRRIMPSQTSQEALGEGNGRD